GGVDQDPGDRDQREDREQEAQRGQPADGAAAQPVERDRDGRGLLLEPLLPPPLAPLRPALARPRRQRERAHQTCPFRRRKISDPTEIATMTTPSTTAPAA